MKLLNLIIYNEKELNKATNSDLNVRIIHLSNFTVSSFQYIGKEPEKTVSDSMCKFVLNNKQYEIKQDSRFFGFNHPNQGILKDGTYGYETWVTIPENFEVTQPFLKKSFPCGFYASITINMGEFNYYDDHAKWVIQSDEYDFNFSDLEYHI